MSNLTWPVDKTLTFWELLSIEKEHERMRKELHAEARWSRESQREDIVKRAMEDNKIMVGMSGYQSRAATTAVYPNSAHVLYPALKLSGEAGEVAEAVGKFLRGDYDAAEMKRRVEKELGDVLWYCAALARDLGIDLGGVAIGNLDKLEARAANGTIKGDGDDREFMSAADVANAAASPLMDKALAKKENDR